MSKKSTGHHCAREQNIDDVQAHYDLSNEFFALFAGSDAYLQLRVLSSART